MFDFGFWEMLMIVLVALIVVGPERLPGLARTIGFWVGKAKRMVNDVKSEIDQELAAENLKKTLGEQNIMNDVYEVIEETKQAGEEIKNGIEKNVSQFKDDNKTNTDSSTDKS